MFLGTLLNTINTVKLLKPTPLLPTLNYDDTDRSYLICCFELVHIKPINLAILL